MTIDERAAAATAEINVAESNEPSDYYDGLVHAIIARHLRAAVAEQAELRAENERLRERVSELAKSRLRDEFNDWARVMRDSTDWFSGMSQDIWIVAHNPDEDALGPRAQKRILPLAEEAGVWFDDDGNEVPLDEWRARMGGAG